MKTEINVPTIPVPEGKARVERFRRQLAKSVPAENIPRAVLIPIADILAIVNRYQFMDKNGDIRNELQGIRAYFAIKDGDEDLPDDITALIVPVDLRGKDIVRTVDLGDGVGDDENNSQIYDFTKPCPDLCDPESPLFVP